MDFIVAFSEIGSDCYYYLRVTCSVEHGEESLKWLLHNCHKIHHSAFKSIIVNRTISVGMQKGLSTALNIKGQLVLSFASHSSEKHEKDVSYNSEGWLGLYSPVIVSGNNTSVWEICKD